MVTLEQVEQLEAKVRQVVAIVEELRADNDRLRLEKKQLESDFEVLRERYESATSKAGALEGAQLMVEKGILEAIDMLDEASRTYHEENEEEVIPARSEDAGEPYIVPQESEEGSTNESNAY